ncbi:MAG: hypothetical protein ABSD67_16510 [Terracidiphilus sp.]
MQNASNGRRAKLMNGRPRVQTIVEADIQPPGEGGDVGFVIHTSQEEVGVDSYNGCFAGLRDLDDTLSPSRAEYGWHEFQAIPNGKGILVAICIEQQCS